jgi:hypothetical protein
VNTSVAGSPLFTFTSRGENPASLTVISIRRAAPAVAGAPELARVASG